MIDYAYIDSTIIHGDTDPNLSANIALTGVRGLGSPPPRQASYSRARRHGAVDNTRYYEGRVIALDGEVWATADKTAVEAFDELKAALMLGDLAHTFKFRRTGMSEDEQATVIVASELEWQVTDETFIVWGVSLFAADPLLYASAEKTGSYDPTTASTGRGISFPLRFPLVFAGEATTHLTVVNSGNFPTPPIFTIIGPVTNPVIDNDTTGESIYTAGLTLAAGDQAVIDVAERELRLGESAPYSTVITDAAPVAYWKFDETSAASGIADSMGLLPAAVWSGGLETVGVAGALSEGGLAVAPDGDGAQIASAALNFLGGVPFSVECWYKPEVGIQGDATFRRIISSEWNDGANQGWQCSAKGTGELQFQRFDATGNDTLSATVTWGYGSWHHIAFVFDGATYVIYLNGVAVASTTPASPAVLKAGAPATVSLFQRDTDAGIALIASVDDMSVWDRALSAAEVSLHYQSGLAVQSDGTPRADLIDPRLTTWYDLQPGSNELRLRGDGMVNGQTLLEVTYHDARI